MSDGLNLPQFTAAQTDWETRVLGQSRHMEFRLGSADWVAHVVRPPQAASSAIVRVLAGETSLWVGLSDWDALFQSSAVTAGVILADLPPEIAVAVIEAAAESVLESLSKATGQSWTVIEFLHGQQPPHPWRVGFQLAGPQGASLHGQLAAAPTDLEVVEALISRCPAARGTAVLPPLVTAVEIGMTSLPVGELRALRPRDVLLLDVTAFVPNRHAVIRTSKTSAWRVTVGEGQATLVEPRTTTPATALPLESPSVNIVIEFGDVVIPGDSLPGLAAGQVVPIERAGGIRLSIDGRPFATGELIELGPKLGVRLLELGRSPR